MVMFLIMCLLLCKLQTLILGGLLIQWPLTLTLVIERPIYWTMNPFSHIRELHKIMQGKYVVNNCRFPDFLILSALYHVPQNMEAEHDLFPRSDLNWSQYS